MRINEEDLDRDELLKVVKVLKKECFDLKELNDKARSKFALRLERDFQFRRLLEKNRLLDKAFKQVDALYTEERASRKCICGA